MMGQQQVEDYLESLKRDRKKVSKRFDRDDNVDDMHYLEELDAKINALEYILSSSYKG